MHPQEEVKRLFAAALEQPGSARAAFLRGACGADATMRAEVEALLAAADAAGRFLARPGGATAAPPLQAGDRLGPYRLRQTLGEGAFGTVWLAEQESPVRREVALKVLKAGMDTAQVSGRFEAERQALALMDHPNIAKVFDGGATPQGRPYCVLELVRGEPVTRFCDQARLTPRQRLELFVPICQAVQHAHQKGVIHRDLKPSNILVAVHDGRPVPKVIDFGIAKAIGGRLTVDTVVTADQQLLGTPEYMAPEQAEAGEVDVDTRADIYSLGVLLYELLTGSRPFEHAGLPELLRRIREDEPARPSTRVTTLAGEKLAQVAGQRRLPPRALRRLLHGDLDWIVLKALEKDRSRRYATAAAFADDIARHLAHEPVQARPPGAGYRLRKYVRRHRLGLAAGAAVAVSLAAGLVVALQGWREAAAQASLATTARGHERTQRTVAEERARELAATAATLRRRTDEFELLALVMQIDEAERAEAALHPPWPDLLPAMTDWLRKAEELTGAAPRVGSALAELRARALPPTAAEQEADRRTHPRAAELQRAQGRLRTLRRGTALRAVPEPEPPVPAAVTRTYRHLTAYALGLTGPTVEVRADGEELQALAAARAGRELAAPAERAKAAMILAWALFACGRDAEALEAADESLAQVADADRAQCVDHHARLRQAIDAASGERGAQAITALVREVEALEAEVASRRTWRFASDADAFLFRTLGELEARLEAFARRTSVSVAERARWAERIAALTEAHPRAPATWAAARSALAAADGAGASERYRAVPIDLKPQLGLVPIGRNPATGLWEFYDLRSADDPQRPVDPATIPIPTHRPDGTLDLDGDSGIVFVLVPGGTFVCGAQAEDPTAANFDPRARNFEGPPVQVALAPFLLARHELTQGQWRRLSGGETPSWYRIGGTYGPAPPDPARHPIGWAHPVEQVSWAMATALLERHGMALPTEAQWEYCCRAGTATPWWTGAEPESLAGAANLLDAVAEAAYPQWGRAEGGLDDGYAGPAAVGTFAANPWGFHDVHGNLHEWCQDWVTSDPTPMRPGDGLRLVPDATRFRAVRGGGYNAPAGGARVSGVEGLPPEIRNTFTGVRAARSLAK